MAQKLYKLNFALGILILSIPVQSLFAQPNLQVQEETAQLFSDPLDRIIWSTPGRLTLSFAEDGTDIAGNSSTLMSSFESLLSPTEIEELVIEAFQQWAELSSINVGLVSDNVSVPFGTSGPTQTDLSVGDVRVGAVPMSGDVFAVAVPHNELLSGGWSGTLLFNSNASFSSADQFFAVALHEAGHVFGLEHTQNINAVMHPTALNTEFDAQDIEEIQALYGTRELDLYDLGNASNDSIANATEVENSGSIDGLVPTIAFGDIGGVEDVDYFLIETRSDYIGSFTVTLNNRAISMADLKITIIDDEGTQYGEQTGTGSRGDEIQIQVANSSPELEYYARVELAPGSKYSTGSYALITTFDANVELDSLTYIEQIIRRNYNFVEQDQIQELFCQDEPFCDGLLDLGLNDEFKGPSNDTFATATILEPLIEFPGENRYRVQGSLQTNLVDVDYYRFAAPEECSNLTINVDAFEIGGPITDVVLFDANQIEIEGRTFVNGNGELLIQYRNILPSKDYIVKVQADDPNVFGTGNYQLDIAFCTPTINVRELADGELLPGGTPAKHSLYVARSQLFHFALRTEFDTQTLPSELANATVWMSIFDEDGCVVHRVATRVGGIRSSRSVVLRPGSYAVRLNFTQSTKPRSRRLVFPIRYVIEGVGISEPTGPEIIEDADDPFAPCDKLSNEFCYPNDEMSSEPFIIVDGDGFKPSSPPEVPAWQDANVWYWETNWLG